MQTNFTIAIIGRIFQLPRAYFAQYKKIFPQNIFARVITIVLFCLYEQNKVFLNN